MSKKLKPHIEQRNRYLDDIGLKAHEYGVNFTYDDEPRECVERWKEQREMYGFDDRGIYEFRHLRRVALQPFDDVLDKAIGAKNSVYLCLAFYSL